MSAALQKRRKELRQELTLIEKQLYDLETTYLEETKEFGNIFTGWDAYLGNEKVKPKKITNEDRLFSLSSVTSPASRREESKKAAKATGGDAPGSAKKRKLNKNPDNEAKDTIKESTDQ